MRWEVPGDREVLVGGWFTEFGWLNNTELATQSLDRDSLTIAGLARLFQALCRD